MALAAAAEREKRATIKACYDDAKKAFAIFVSGGGGGSNPMQLHILDTHLPEGRREAKPPHKMTKLKCFLSVRKSHSKSLSFVAPRYVFSYLS